MNLALQFELQPILDGGTIILTPLQGRDFEPLYAVASDPLIWEQHPEPTRYRREIFEAFFAGAMASGGALLVRHKTTGEVIGTSRYYEWNPAGKEVAIGYTFLTREHWGGVTNLEMKSLMLNHAFRWASVVWFHIGKNNWRSRKAMEKIGGVLDRETTKELNGVVHEYAFYRIDAQPNHARWAVANTLPARDARGRA